jgi:hypothetical protein
MSTKAKQADGVGMQTNEQSDLERAVAAALASVNVNPEAVPKLLTQLTQRESELRNELQACVAELETAESALRDFSGKLAIETDQRRKVELQRDLSETRAAFIEATAKKTALTGELNQLRLPLAQLKEENERQQFTRFLESDIKPKTTAILEQIAELKGATKKKVDELKTLARQLSATLATWNKTANVVRFPQTALELEGAQTVLADLDKFALSVPDITPRPSVWVKLAENFHPGGYRVRPGNIVQVDAKTAAEWTNRRYGDWVAATYLSPQEIEQMEHTH